jgi:hypothetical protein
MTDTTTHDPIEAFVAGAAWQYWKTTGDTQSDIEKQVSRDAARRTISRLLR